MVAGSACVCGHWGCKLLSAGGLAAPIPAGSYEIGGRRLTIKLAQVPQLTRVGGSVKVINVNLPRSVIVARARENEYVAADLYCGHAAGEIKYVGSDQVFRCTNYHGGEFKENGTKVSGPGPARLPTYLASRAETDNDELVVMFPD